MLTRSPLDCAWGVKFAPVTRNSHHRSGGARFRGCRLRENFMQRIILLNVGLHRCRELLYGVALYHYEQDFHIATDGGQRMLRFCCTDAVLVLAVFVATAYSEKGM